jgi:alpha-L-fucosidase
VINNRTGLSEDHDTGAARGQVPGRRPWESCITICRQWAWKPNDEMKSLRNACRPSCCAPAARGNLLFNVGPMPDGRIEPPRSSASGDGHLAREAGDSTTARVVVPAANRPPPALGGNIVFLHVLRWDDDSVAARHPAQVTKATLLGGGRWKCGRPKANWR